MMLNVVFYNSEAVIRVAEKAMKYFAGHVGLRTTVDTIWFNGLYLKFYPRMVTLMARLPFLSRRFAIVCSSF